MARYQADVWLGSSSGRQRVYVNSNTWNGAREQIKTIYHVKDGDIWNLCESREREQSDSSTFSLGSILAFAAVCFIISFWKYFLILGLFLITFWLVYQFIKE